METQMTQETMEPQEARESGLPGYLTIAEAAVLLGVSPGAIYQRVKRLKLPVRRAGRTLLLDGDVVMQLFAKVRTYQRH